MDYTWGHLDETVHNVVHPGCLIPGRSHNQQAQSSSEPVGACYQDQPQYCRPYQQNCTIIRPRSVSELTEGRGSVVSPISPVSPISTTLSTEFSSYQPTPQHRHQRPGVVPPQSQESTRVPQQSRGMIWSLQTPVRGAPSPWSPQQTRPNSWSPQCFSPLSPHEARNKPLPPLPSMGYSDKQDEPPRIFESSPWASPVQQRSRRPPRSHPGNQGLTSTWTDPKILLLPSETRLEDPQRIRTLSQLQEAMMTVDSLDGDCSPDGMGEAREPHKGPRGLGWAITRSDFNTNTGLERPPPPYSQWDNQWEDFGFRRCSSAH